MPTLSNASQLQSNLYTPQIVSEYYITTFIIVPTLVKDNGNVQVTVIYTHLPWTYVAVRRSMYALHNTSE